LLNTATPSFESINGVAAFTGTAQAINTSHRYVRNGSFYDPFAPVPAADGSVSMPNSSTKGSTAGRNWQYLTQFDTPVHQYQ